MMNKLVAILALLAVCFSQTKPNRNIAIPANAFKLLYSQNQKYFLAASGSQVSLYWGVNGTHIEDLDLEGDIDVSAVAFSPTNSKIAVGFKEGLIRIYNIGQDT